MFTHFLFIFLRMMFSTQPLNSYNLHFLLARPVEGMITQYEEPFIYHFCSSLLTWDINWSVIFGPI